MKRLLSAALLAVILHAWLFSLKLTWLINKTVRQQSDITPITITMSYRLPEVAPEKKEPAGQTAPKPKEVKPEKQPKQERPRKIINAALRPVGQDKAERPEPVTVGEGAENKVVEETVAISSDMDEKEENNNSASDSVSARITREAVPSYRVNPSPEYPRIARRRGWQGIVILSVFVNEKGRVSNLWVSNSSGYTVLDNAAVEAVRKWSFEPGAKGDMKVAMWVKVPIRFELKP
ncbi:conserved hypothetical protein [uncultured Desulfobacterium sp.]|uniref:TonB C-terminal domain-containing protein n=1 Tax=uncultured Desulfobacterium sp. TaxID=201089 RepID=A0A445MQM0_9BACT|nr:conserved hypothetical protein [uncultured Desulfobacterium sp.]